MVVNSMMVGMTAQAERPGQTIYQVGTSARNPIRYETLQDFGLRYFTVNPYINKEGKAVKVGKITVLKSMSSFHRYMALHYLLWLKGLELVNAAFCKSLEGTYGDLDGKIKFAMRLVELYRPYLFLKGVFDDTNMEKLQAAMTESGAAETDVFYFDPDSIVKYIFK